MAERWLLIFAGWVTAGLVVDDRYGDRVDLTENGHDLVLIAWPVFAVILVIDAVARYASRLQERSR